MDCLVMCGGQGTRLSAASEKPLYPVGGTPLVDRVLAAVRESGVEDVHAVTSPHTPYTHRHLAAQQAVDLVETSGAGYVADLQEALDAPGVRAGTDAPVLSVAADLPLLAGDAIDAVLDDHDTGSMTVCVPAVLPATLGVETDAAFADDGRTLVPTGVNVVGGDPDHTRVTWDARLAVNVNYPADAAVAERLLSGLPD